MSSLSCFNASFLNSDSVFSDNYNHGVDIDVADECFKIISKIEHPSILDTVSSIDIYAKYYEYIEKRK